MSSNNSLRLISVSMLMSALQRVNMKGARYVTDSLGSIPLSPTTTGSVASGRASDVETLPNQYVGHPCDPPHPPHQMKALAKNDSLSVDFMSIRLQQKIFQIYFQRNCRFQPLKEANTQGCVYCRFSPTKINNIKLKV